MPRFRKKPVEIEAFRFGFDMPHLWFKDAVDSGAVTVEADGTATVRTLEDGADGRAKHVADRGDYIIRGIKGELYPCKPDIFEATYDAVEMAE